MRACRISLLALVAACAGCGDTGADSIDARVLQVFDGDTILVRLGAREQRVRLHGIDAPEHGQPHGEASKRALRRLVDGRQVRVEVVTTDDFGRLVGKVMLGDKDVNAAMVGDGHAWVFRRYTRDQRLIDLEKAAREAGRGLWAEAATPPWEWREEARAQSVRGSDCRIKGNITSRGKIYHLPGSEAYAKTRISTANGERWFCTEAEARAAGWRRAGSR